MKKNNLKNFLTGVVALGTVLALLTGCTNATASVSGSVKAGESDDLRTLRVAIMTNQTDQYATYIGTEAGIFEKHNIKLDITEYVAGINTVDAIVNGTADTGLLADFAAVNRLGNTLHDTNLNLFAELSRSKSTQGGVYVAPEFADDPSRLSEGDGWIAQIGTVTEYINWQAQKALNLDPATQKTVNIDSQQTALALAQNGGASAVVASGAQAEKYENYGWVRILDYGDIGSVIGAYLVTTNDFLAENVDLLADYLVALDESVQYINDNLDDSAEKISARYGIDAEQFKLDWKVPSIIIGFSEEGAQNLDDVNSWAYGEGRYPEAYNVRDFIKTDAIEKAFPERVTIEK